MNEVRVMGSPTWDYTPTDLVEGFQKLGIGQGDALFVHVSLGLLGRPRECTTTEEACELLLGTLQEAVGPDGTILVPTYTYSFCQGEDFNIQHTPSTVGPFTEYFRQLPGVSRSVDPIFSVAGLGPKAEELFANLPHTCFGEDSIYSRMVRSGVKICTVGVGLYWATFRHHAEETSGVPFRFKKLFTGYVVDGDERRKEGWIYYVRILADNSEADARCLEQKARDMEICKVVPVGRGEMLCIDSRDYFEFTRKELAKDPWFTAQGPPGDPLGLETARVGAKQPAVTLPADASMKQMIDVLWRLRRDILSEGYDAALYALAKQVPMTVHEYPTGTECWTWIVPEKWTCHEAYLETLDGKRLFSYTDHPLHVVSYSLAFEGEVSREELFDHLHVHSRIPEAIPFVFKYYERDWGLCCSQQLKDSLTNDAYRVVIRTDFSYSTLKVGEIVVPGACEETIVLCVHLDHPAMVNDDLTGVVVGIEVIRVLLERRNLRYTYRLLILPETIGSIAYLSRHEALIPKMKGGLFLEMLGSMNPHALQLSFDGNTELDLCFTQAVKEHAVDSWTGAFQKIIGNDERHFNAPGVRVSMLSLSRVLPQSDPDWPYREYHSSHDTPERISIQSLEDSRDLILRMIDTLEENRIPVNQFKGEVFCSRYGIHIDSSIDLEGERALFDVIYLIDGTRSVAEIADACDVSFWSAKKTIDVLHRNGLVQYTDLHR